MIFVCLFPACSFGMIPTSPLPIHTPLMPSQTIDLSLPINTIGPVMKMDPLNNLQVQNHFHSPDIWTAVQHMQGTDQRSPSHSRLSVGGCWAVIGCLWLTVACTFCGVLCSIETSHPLSGLVQPIEHVEYESEAVSERKLSNWLLSLEHQWFLLFSAVSLLFASIIHLLSFNKLKIAHLPTTPHISHNTAHLSRTEQA